MRICLISLNPTIGALKANALLIAEAAAVARNAGAELAVFPELALSGYPPKDLLLQHGFIDACARTAHELGYAASNGLTLIFGAPTRSQNAESTAPGPIHNSLLVYRDGRSLARYDKRLLPTYDVFDEDRYFTPGRRPVVVDVSGGRVGLSICEDLWKGEDAGFARRYHDAPDPVAELVSAGATVIVSPSASPFVLGKGDRHRSIVRSHAERHGVAVLSVNQCGGDDELIFDGHAIAFGPGGRLLADGPEFETATTLVDLPDAETTQPEAPLRLRMRDSSPEQDLFRALVLGVRDYLRKTGFRTALLGLSGGIDSALTAVIGAAAVGAENILGVAMPSKYSSSHSVADAEDLARRIGLGYLKIPIEGGVGGMAEMIDAGFRSRGLPALGATLPDLSEENLQSRVRGTTLMALSNRTGAIVLTTGNKSELAVGYCTLYGDMNGGLAVLSDVSKQWVYRLSRWINDHHRDCGFATPPIPESSITKPPSAELRPDQKDQDSLPPYDVLDDIIERYIERRESVADIVRGGFDEPLVRRVVRMIDLAEYKRKQAAIGLKVTTVAFGSGRRWPIAQGWRGE